MRSWSSQTKSPRSDGAKVRSAAASTTPSPTKNGRSTAPGTSRTVSVDRRARHAMAMCHSMAAHEGDAVDAMGDAADRGVRRWRSGGRAVSRGRDRRVPCRGRLPVRGPVLGGDPVPRGRRWAHHLRRPGGLDRGSVRRPALAGRPRWAPPLRDRVVLPRRRVRGLGRRRCGLRGLVRGQLRLRFGLLRRARRRGQTARGACAHPRSCTAASQALPRGAGAPRRAAPARAACGRGRRPRASTTARATMSAGAPAAR
jgi:hypothetical protein